MHLLRIYEIKTWKWTVLFQKGKKYNFRAGQYKTWNWAVFLYSLLLDTESSFTTALQEKYSKLESFRTRKLPHGFKKHFCDKLCNAQRGKKSCLFGQKIRRMKIDRQIKWNVRNQTTADIRKWHLITLLVHWGW